ncbi:DNA glycosylase AlkZ-like family protein [Arthrobacter yangruifuii]|uniref:DNA glycosylase AlkZ-like family protein n=1 Tax=Arthrobacter yangruifuii TaxID=2606616 RepID=UPI001644EFAB|nr:crosslink repair DNA glycosylase YcaQ family protein [Arthrobacter yangruifuii]
MALELTDAQARRLRLRSHLLLGSDLAPADVVRRAVALQGQDLPAVLRAVAVRSRPGTTVQDVRDAFDSGELVRGWPMRGTLFATTPAHLAALLRFTAERTRAAAARRRTELGLDDAVLSRSRASLREALGERPLRRAEILELWSRAGIETADGRGYLPSADAPGGRGPFPLGQVCSGGHGTARHPHGRPWHGRHRRGRRRPQPHRPRIRAGARPGHGRGPGLVDQAAQSVVPGKNGIFRPAILVDGVVVGTWRPPRGKRTAEPVIRLVEPVTPATRRAAEKAVAAWPHG